MTVVANKASLPESLKPNFAESLQIVQNKLRMCHKQQVIKIALEILMSVKQQHMNCLVDSTLSEKIIFFKNNEVILPEDLEGHEKIFDSLQHSLDDALSYDLHIKIDLINQEGRLALIDFAQSGHLK